MIALKRFLITRPQHDPVTTYFYAWSAELVETAKSNGWTVEDLRVDVMRSETQSRLSSNQPSFVVFNGHGNEGSIEGSAGEIVVDVPSAHLLGGAICFARACSVLSVLGRATVEKGCRAFIGYRGKFSFARVNEYEAKPLQDPAAGPVLEVSNVVPLRILEGHSVQESIDAAHTATKKHALRLLSSQENYANAALKYLMYNDTFLGFEGNGGAKVL